MAFTFAGQYTEVILGTSSAGFAVALPSLSVHVYTVGTTTHPTLYTSRTKGTTTANPTTSDANGNLTFFVDPGQYDIVFTPPGGSQKRITVTVPTDPAESSAAGVPVVRPESFGADPTGATDSTTAFQQARDSLPSVTITNGTTTTSYRVGTIRLSSGATYKIGTSGDVGNLGPFVSVIGPGRNECIVNYVGSGQAFRRQSNVHPNSNTFDTMFSQNAPYGLGAKITGFILDGAGASAGAYGLWDGDFEGAILGDDLTIRHFNKTGSVGLWLQSEYSWYENAKHRVDLVDNTICVVLDAATGKNSFAYNDLNYKTYIWPNQDGVVIQNGAYVYNGTLEIRGNSGKGPTNTGAVLRLQGSSSGLYSALVNEVIIVGVEANTLQGIANTTAHQTWYFGDAANNRVECCSGSLSFSNHTPSNWTQSMGNVFQFDGPVIGDASLNPLYSQLPSHLFPNIRRKGFVSAGTLDLTSGDYFDIPQLSANTTLTFSTTSVGRGTLSLIGSRRILVRAQQGSNYWNITWPSGIQWEGGIAPLVDPAPASYSWFDLWTLDGTLWYGRQLHSMNTAPTLPAPVVASRVNLHSATTVTSQSLTPGATMATNNTLIVACADLNPGGTSVPTVTDTKGNTYVLDKQQGSAGARIWIYRALLTSSLLTSDRVNVSWSVATYPSTWAIEVSGLGTTGTLDVAAGADSGATSTTSVTVPPILTSYNNALLLGFVTAAAQDVSPPSWTNNPTDWNGWVGGARALQPMPLNQPAAGPSKKFAPVASASQPLAAVVVAYHP